MMVYQKAYDKMYSNIKDVKFQEVLQGVIDTHIHAGPEAMIRRMDMWDVASEARDAGMAAVVCKPYTYCNAPLAKLTEKMVPGIRVFGGLTLDLAVGGYNPRAVEAAINLGAKFIWGSVFDAEATLEKSQNVSWLGELGASKERVGLRPVDAKGGIKEEIKDILQLIADAGGVILGTGHQFPDDCLKIIEAAKKAGIQYVLSTHPHSPVVGANIDHQKEMIKLGAILEYVWCNATPYYDRTDPAEYAEAIKELGPQNIIMATDFGQPVNSSPTEGMATFIVTMMAKGISPDDINIMTRKNPAKILGI